VISANESIELNIRLKRYASALGISVVRVYRFFPDYPLFVLTNVRTLTWEEYHDISSLAPVAGIEGPFVCPRLKSSIGAEIHKIYSVSDEACPRLTTYGYDTVESDIFFMRMGVLSFAGSKAMDELEAIDAELFKENIKNL